MPSQVSYQSPSWDNYKAGCNNSFSGAILALRVFEVAMIALAFTCIGVGIAATVGTLGAGVTVGGPLIGLGIAILLHYVGFKAATWCL